MSKFIYGRWNDDKPAEEGFSKELISSDFDIIKAKGATLDDMHATPFENVNTLYDAMKRNIDRIPNQECYGTRHGDEYKWINYKDAMDTAEKASHGMMMLKLCPTLTFDGDEKEWRMMGIMSKNRKEWNIMNIANFHQGVTTVALYDTLGADAMRFVCNQTELTSIACSNDCISKLAKMKKDDKETSEPKMQRLVNLVCFDPITEEEKVAAQGAELELI
jgi:long-chain acyl-CoA synthetase